MPALQHRLTLWGLRAAALLHFDPISRRTISGSISWQRLGSRSCGWLAPTNWNVTRPVAYCVGAGEDISFDLALANEKGAEVHVFDPTPRAVRHFHQASRGALGELTLHTIAIWDRDGEVELFAPANPAHVSHSIVNLQGTRTTFVADCRTLSSVAQELSHARIDLLKIDIEGAEYEVLDDLLRNGPPVGVLNVEFDEISCPRAGSWTRIRDCVTKLEKGGFRLESIDSASNYTFLNRGYAHATE